MESHNNNEKEGLIPVTIGLINACRRKDDKLEYQGVMLNEIVIVGILIKYEDLDTKTVVGVWDQTGYRDILFYNRSESEPHSGLSGFSITAEKMPVKIFCKVKYYKDDIRLDGAKIVKVDMNEFIYHKITVLNDWDYLVGRLNDDVGINNHTTTKEFASGYKNNFNNNNNNNNSSKDDNYDIVYNAIKKIENSKGNASLDQIAGVTNMSKEALAHVCNRLVIDCKIIETGTGVFNMIWDYYEGYLNIIN